MTDGPGRSTRGELGLGRGWDAAAPTLGPWGSWALDCLSRAAGRGVVYVSERGPDALSVAGPWVSSLC